MFHRFYMTCAALLATGLLAVCESTVSGGDEGGLTPPSSSSEEKQVVVGQSGYETLANALASVNGDSWTDYTLIIPGTDSELPPVTLLGPGESPVASSVSLSPGLFLSSQTTLKKTRTITLKAQGFNVNLSLKSGETGSLFTVNSNVTLVLDKGITVIKSGATDNPAPLLTVMGGLTVRDNAMLSASGEKDRANNASAVSLTGTLRIEGDAIIKGNVYDAGAVTISGSSRIDGELHVASGSTVTAAGTLTPLGGKSVTKIIAPGGDSDRAKYDSLASVVDTSAYTSVAGIYLLNNGSGKQVLTIEKLLKYESLTLRGSVTPAEATNRTLRWTTSAADVAAIEDSGDGTAVVKWISEGSAKITAWAQDGKSAGLTLFCEGEAGSSQGFSVLPSPDDPGTTKSLFLIFDGSGMAGLTADNVVIDPKETGAVKYEEAGGSLVPIAGEQVYRLQLGGIGRSGDVGVRIVNEGETLASQTAALKYVPPVYETISIEAIQGATLPTGGGTLSLEQGKTVTIRASHYGYFDEHLAGNPPRPVIDMTVKASLPAGLSASIADAADKSGTTLSFGSFEGSATGYVGNMTLTGQDGSVEYIPVRIVTVADADFDSAVRGGAADIYVRAPVNTQAGHSLSAGRKIIIEGSGNLLIADDFVSEGTIEVRGSNSGITIEAGRTLNLAGSGAVFVNAGASVGGIITGEERATFSYDYGKTVSVTGSLRVPSGNDGLWLQNGVLRLQNGGRISFGDSAGDAGSGGLTLLHGATSIYTATGLVKLSFAGDTLTLDGGSGAILRIDATGAGINDSAPALMNFAAGQKLTIRNGVSLEAPGPANAEGLPPAVFSFADGLRFSGAKAVGSDITVASDAEASGRAELRAAAAGGTLLMNAAFSLASSKPLAFEGTPLTLMMGGANGAYWSMTGNGASFTASPAGSANRHTLDAGNIVKGAAGTVTGDLTINVGALVAVDSLHLGGIWSSTEGRIVLGAAGTLSLNGKITTNNPAGGAGKFSGTSQPASTGNINIRKASSGDYLADITSYSSGGIIVGNATGFVISSATGVISN